jgi:hypothetical protein
VTDETTEPQDFTEEELAEQRGEALPDRQAMSIVTTQLERPIPLDGPDLAPPPVAE